jgi:glyoxylase-like metal-dependent hydrolase (beta-lactamase superfamily II)
MRDLPEKRFVEVADGVMAVVHGDGTMGVANCAVIADGGSAFAYDALTLPEMASGVIDETARRGLRVTTVLNSHHHVDHVGGNAAFGDAEVVAHPIAASIVSRMSGHLDQVARLIPRFAAELASLDVRSPSPAPAGLTVPRGGQLLTFTPAHSPADVAVWLPRERVLLAGDVCFNGVTPLAVQGVISAWVDAVDRLIALDPAVVVPGHGPLATAADLMTLRGYLATLWDTARRAHRDGVPEVEALAELDTGAVGEWLEPGRTVINFRRALLEARGELGDGL